MAALRELLGSLFGALYIGSPVLMVVFFALVAAAGLASVLVAVGAALRRRWGLALVAALLALPTLPFGVFVVGVADGVAWPGRDAALTPTDLVGEYGQDDVDLTISLDADGTWRATGKDWAPVLQLGPGDLSTAGLDALQDAQRRQGAYLSDYHPFLAER